MVKNLCMYVHEGIIIPVILHCSRTPELYKFKRSLGFKLQDVINCKEQTVLESIKDAFEEEICKLNTMYQFTKLIFIFMSINWQ